MLSSESVEVWNQILLRFLQAIIFTLEGDSERHLYRYKLGFMIATLYFLIYTGSVQGCDLGVERTDYVVLFNRCSSFSQQNSTPQILRNSPSVTFSRLSQPRIIFHETKKIYTYTLPTRCIFQYGTIRTFNLCLSLSHSFNATHHELQR